MRKSYGESFDFLKKTEATETTESNKETVETKDNACVGVLDFLPNEGNESIIDCWESRR